MPIRDAAKRLRGASLRVTAQRTAVLDVLERHGHSDARFVTYAVRKEIGSVSTQAIYDVLAALVQAGLVRKIEPAGSSALFELHADDNQACARPARRSARALTA